MNSYTNFDEHKKDPVLAVVISLLPIPTVGHLYAGNWKRGFLFAIPKFGFAILIVKDFGNIYGGPKPGPYGSTKKKKENIELNIQTVIDLLQLHSMKILNLKYMIAYKQM